MTAQFTRREFVKIGLAATAANAWLVPGTAAPAPDAARSVRLGVIGVGGRGTHLLQLALQHKGVSVPAICDIHPDNLRRAQNLVEKKLGERPVGFSDGPVDYRRLLARDDVDAVLIGTPMPLHGPMSVDGLSAGKHVLSEVSATMTVQECWDLVRAAEKSGRVYMLAENCCYYRQNMAVQRMVREGIFGDLTFAECGYVHDCRAYAFNPDGSLTWRGEMSRDLIGNLYPTHALGPVSQWLNINRGDRLVSLVAFTSASKAMAQYQAKNFPPENPARTIKFAVGDTTTTLIRTARGAVIDLRYDTLSSRPHPSTTYFTLQGTTAAYKDDGVQQQIWVNGKTAGYQWESFTPYAQQHEHPLWTRSGERAQTSGHGGADYFVIEQFLEAIRSGQPSPIDACDAAAWSCILPLSAESIRAGGNSVAIPDFTRGAWKKRG